MYRICTGKIQRSRPHLAPAGRSPRTLPRPQRGRPQKQARVAADGLGEAGKPVNTLLLAEKFVITRERYFAILMDRGSGGPVLIGSKVGRRESRSGRVDVESLTC